MPCKGRCVAIKEQVMDPLDLGRETVVSIVAMKKPWGEIWPPGVTHWRCQDCGSKTPDDPAPGAAQQRVPTVSELQAQEARIRQKIRGIY